MKFPLKFSKTVSSLIHGSVPKAKSYSSTINIEVVDVGDTERKSCLLLKTLALNKISSTIDQSHKPLLHSKKLLVYNSGISKAKISIRNVKELVI